MAYVTKTSRPFVYGAFYVAGPLPPVEGRPYALEILREYSASEFIGKVYFNTPSGWTPMAPYMLAQQSWYARTKRHGKLLFNMEGSGPWEVLHFREESDETGTYLAAALRRPTQ